MSDQRCEMDAERALQLPLNELPLWKVIGSTITHRALFVSHGPGRQPFCN